MRKVATMIIMLLPLFLMGEVRAQKVKFDKYFEDATLRIDYQRAGNRQQDTILGCYDERLPQWAGSKTQLIDPFDNGLFRVVVRDTKRGKVIYSRCFNSLFSEYRDTPMGRDSIQFFEEVLRLPWPKVAVDICWEERGADHVFHQQCTLRYNPEQRLKEINRREYRRPNTRSVQLQYKGDIHHKIDIVIVPEGYGPADTAQMRLDLRRFCDIILAQEPFLSRADDFNIWGIMSTGRESGITDPNKAIHVRSLVGASYNTFGSDRYLMTMNLFRLHDVIGTVPCDHIVIMANSTTYGGGGIYNFYAMSSLTDRADVVLPHELGHSIAGLADEYVDEELSYGGMFGKSFEPVEPNITSLVHFDQKWQHMLPAGTPVPTPDNSQVRRNETGPLGVYEGAGYQAKGMYRPTMHCMMRDLAPFCPVCTQRLIQVFDFYTK